MGVESALPWVPVPASQQPPKAKRGVLFKLVLVLLALVFLLGLWKIGKELRLYGSSEPRYAAIATMSSRVSLATTAFISSAREPVRLPSCMSFSWRTT